MEKYGHFWYSVKQREIGKQHGRNYAIIGDKTVLYTEWTQKKKPSGSWDDYEYLGYGEYSHYEKKDEPIVYRAKYLTMDLGRRTRMNSCIYKNWFSGGGLYEVERKKPFRKAVKGYLKEIDAGVMDIYGKLQGRVKGLEEQLEKHTKDDLHEWKLKVHKMQGEIDELRKQVKAVDKEPVPTTTRHHGSIEVCEPDYLGFIELQQVIEMLLEHCGLTIRKTAGGYAIEGGDSKCCKEAKK